MPRPDRMCQQPFTLSTKKKKSRQTITVDRPAALSGRRFLPLRKALHANADIVFAVFLDQVFDPGPIRRRLTRRFDSLVIETVQETVSDMRRAALGPDLSTSRPPISYTRAVAAPPAGAPWPRLR